MEQLIETLDKIFADKNAGAYLDIGAYDGVAENITYHFYQQGWCGVCVEPQTKYFNQGQKNRPNDTWVKGVVVNAAHPDNRIAFYESADGKGSSIFPSDGARKKNLKAIRINNDIPRDSFPDGLDLLVIDVGREFMDVLRSIDLGIWKPHIVAIAGPAYSAIVYMQAMGYYQLAPNATGDCFVFSNSNEDRRHVRY